MRVRFSKGRISQGCKQCSDSLEPLNQDESDYCYYFFSVTEVQVNYCGLGSGDNGGGGGGCCYVCCLCLFELLRSLRCKWRQVQSSEC